MDTAYKKTSPRLLRFVDDTFTGVHKDEIDDFHKHLQVCRTLEERAVQTTSPGDKLSCFIMCAVAFSRVFRLARP